jgi:hypothetical protein
MSKAARNGLRVEWVMRLNGSQKREEKAMIDKTQIEKYTETISSKLEDLAEEIEQEYRYTSIEERAVAEACASKVRKLADAL